jgi:hypothetical protein
MALGYGWLVQLPILVERVYVLGTGERAQRLVQGLRQNPEIGVEIASWTGKMEGAVTREAVAAHLMDVVKKQKVHRVIVAMPDRRGTIPMQELLELRMQGVKIEEATSWLEKISGKIEVENLYPSWMVFGEGFRRSTTFIAHSARAFGHHFAGRLICSPCRCFLSSCSPSALIPRGLFSTPRRAWARGTPLRS